MGLKCENAEDGSTDGVTTAATAAAAAADRDIAADSNSAVVIGGVLSTGAAVGLVGVAKSWGVTIGGGVGEVESGAVAMKPVNKAPRAGDGGRGVARGGGGGGCGCCCC